MSGSVDAGGELRSKSLIMIQIPGIDGLGLDFRGAGQAQCVVDSTAAKAAPSGARDGGEVLSAME